MRRYRKLFCFISCLLCHIIGFQLGASSLSLNKNDLLFQFKNFVVRYNRSYINNLAEYRYRMSVFEDSIKRQAVLNKKERELNGQVVYGVNKFSDWTREEFINHLSKFTNESLKTGTSCCEINQRLPSQKTWDWRKKHKVTPVKNQGDCGSCWAFSSTGVVETQWAIANDLKSPLELSVQELVSCSDKAGCEGGSVTSTLEWLECARRSLSGDCEKKYYLLPASEYPYEERESACRYGQIEPKEGAQVKCACSKHFKGKEKILANYVSTNGSVAVGVNAVMWHDYISGIIQHHCTDVVINHAVIIEGFNMSGEIPYWIVRNSWGTDFGIDGYLHIKMGGNICGIAEHVSYVRI